MKTNGEISKAPTIRVAAPVIDAGMPVCSELMNALPDPAHADQAVIVNVPMLVDGVNFGDLVRLAAPDELGVRRITEVVMASGHVHVLAAIEDEDPRDLVNELERMFPPHSLRVEGAGGSMISISVHPDIDPLEVSGVIAAWLGAEDETDPYELPIAEPCESEVGAVSWR